MTDWRDRAVCRGAPVDVFFPPSARSTYTTDRRNPEDDITVALTYCAVCTVTDECLDASIATRDWFGVAGGMAGWERRAVWRRRQRQRRAAT